MRGSKEAELGFEGRELDGVPAWCSELTSSQSYTRHVKESIRNLKFRNRETEFIGTNWIRDGTKEQTFGAEN
jgi:hypothetical protein